VIACLFFTAAKCRHFQVRRSAIRVLRGYGGRQENIWNATATAQYASRYIEIETEAAYKYWEGRLNLPLRLKGKDSCLVFAMFFNNSSLRQFEADATPYNRALS
jgi:hypothetical protein